MIKEKKEKKKWTFHLRCTKCSFKFSIERDSSDMNKVDITKMKCMICNSPIQWDTSNFPVSSKPSTKAQSKINTEASIEALRMANEMRKADAEAGINEEILVTNTQKGKGYGKTEKIPKKVIDSIEEKIKPIIEE